ncbi:MAG: glycosyltransferase [Candidatus Doudnabacteria bacterium]|nr:glycosyltransferase [Candidatus Doudnabacteria bacterium]
MTVCFFGNYSPTYPRNVVLKLGLQKNGVQVLECNTRLTGWKKYWALYREHRKLKNDYDFLLVAFGGFTVVWLAKVLTRKKIVFDAFVSLYLTNVEDRKVCRPQSLQARIYAFWDKFSCRLADRVLLDTKAQIDYFVQSYGLPEKKFFRLFVGADDGIFAKGKPLRPSKEFIVHWHGHIVPFHGLKTILRAAEELQDKDEEIKFRIVTRFNSRYQKVKEEVERKNLKNVFFYPEASFAKLAEYLRDADVVLGIFGSNKKAQFVIPNKIFEGIASGKAVITASTSAVLELFTDGQNIVLVEPENPSRLAQAILDLKKDPSLLHPIAERAYWLYQNRLTPKLLGQELVQILQGL